MPCLSTDKETFNVHELTALQIPSGVYQNYFARTRNLYSNKDKIAFKCIDVVSKFIPHRFQLTDTFNQLAPPVTIFDGGRLPVFHVYVVLSAYETTIQDHLPT